MGFEFDVRPAFLRIPGTREDKLLDFVARCPGNRDASVGVDLTVVATMAAKYLTPTLAGNRSRNAKPSPFATTSKAEVNKHRKYDAPVATMNPPPTVHLSPLPSTTSVESGLNSTRPLSSRNFDGLREKESGGWWLWLGRP
jgi:hypothetical protein